MILKSKILSVFILITFLSIKSSFSQEKFKYNVDLNFHIDKVEKWSKIYTGSGHYYTKKGFKYFMVYLTFENTSDKKQLIDFNNFYLIDINNKIKYNVDLALAAGTITWIYRKNKKKLKAKQTKKVKLAITCPEDLNPNFLMLENDEIFPIDPKLISKD
ncbi:hypothetical protein [Sinomicrobium sp. M5D2P9]